MTEAVKLDDAVLKTAGVSLVQASSMMTSDTVRRPSGDLPSLTGIDSTVARYLTGVSIARAALADGARTGSEAVAQVMSESAALDQYVFQTLGTGFAVDGGRV